MKPYVICHMMTSVDGRIKTDRWNLKKSDDVYEKIGGKIKSDGWIVGRTTAEELADSKSRKAVAAKSPIDKTDFVAEHRAKSFAVSIDPKGKVNWKSGKLDSDHVIEVLTENVSSEFLHYLRGKKVSYIFGGETSLDLAVVLKKLKKLFGIKRIIVEGGGTNNGSFLQAGLIDELSLIVAPVADGTLGDPTLFDLVPQKSTSAATPLKLMSVKRLKKNFLLLRYKFVT